MPRAMTIALDLAEPQLNLVEPRGVGRSEVQVNLGVCFQEIFDGLTLVRREVIGDHVDLFAPRLIDHDVGEEGDELRRGVPIGSLAQHLAGLGVEGCVKRQRAVPEILKAMPFGSSRGERQHRTFAIQGLNMRLFIDAEHGSMRRRVQIQPDDISGLLLEVRIVRGHVALDPMGLQAVFAPHPHHHHVADTQLFSQLACRPVRRGARRVPGAPQDLRLQLRGKDRCNLADVSAVEPRDPLLSESLAPTGHKSSAALNPLRGFIPRMAIGQEQDQTGSSGIFGPICPAVGSPSQFHTLRVRQGNGVCHGCHHSL